MANFYMRLSVLGRAAVAAAIAAGPALAISQLAIGDGAGGLHDPTGNETALWAERARVAVESVVRVDDTLLVTATFPAATGGWWIREAGIYLTGGTLLGYAKIPEAYKPTIAEGGSFDYQLTLKVKVSASAPVTIIEQASDAFANLDYVRSRQSFFAVKGMTSTAPPGGPAVGDTYLIPAGPTGAWAGKADNLAYWRGATDGWLFFVPPKGSVACAELTGRMMRYTAAGWRTVPATNAEMIAGTDADLLVSPAGVRVAVDASRHSYAVTSATTAATPGAPAVRATYLVPTGATGAWAGKDGQIALWDGAAWAYYDLVQGSTVSAVDTGAQWKRTATGWRLQAATVAEIIAGVAVDLDVSPAALITALETMRADLIVASATTTAPPGGPANRTAYIVPAGATGAWAGQAGKVAVYVTASAGWVFYSMPNGTLAMSVDTGVGWKMVAGAWRTQAATLAEVLAGTSVADFVTPAGVMGAIEATRAYAIVASATTTAPPAAAARAAYLIPAGATGAWAGKSNQVAVWDGAAWLYYTMPNGTRLIAVDTGAPWKLVAGTWRGQVATAAEHLTGTSAVDFATPLGVMGAIEATRGFIVTASATTTAPPAAAARAAYLIPAGATGAWAGKTNQVAVWDGAAWLYYTMPNGTRLIAVDTGVGWKLVAGTWRTDVATPAEHLAGTSLVDFCNPAGVKSMIDAALAAASIADPSDSFFHGMF